MLSGFEVITATRTAGAYDSSYPWRLVVHRTQGSTIAGAVGAYRSHGGWPHITASYRERRRAQHIELGTAARALRNAPGGEQTNLARCIQVELTGFSETPMSNAEADWVADQVIAPIVAAVPIKLHGPRFYDDNEGIVLATSSSPIRMSSAQWRAFDGICGHQHVGEGNTHWDPGCIPLDRIISRLSSSSSTGDWFDMASRRDLERIVKTYARDQQRAWMERELPGIIRAATPSIEQINLVAIAAARFARDEQPDQEVDLDEIARFVAEATRQAVIETLPNALADLDAEAIAAAVVQALPPELAQQVVAEIGTRLSEADGS